MEILSLAGRILYGGFFLMMGVSHFKNKTALTQYAAMKNVPMPKLAVAGSGLLILFGGLGVLLGVYIEFALWCIIVFLIPVTLKMHAFWRVANPSERMIEIVNFSKNAALLGTALLLLGLAPDFWLL